MTIKKPMKSAGGAAIANRLRLDAQPETKGATLSSKGVAAAFSAGLVALAVVGGLTYLLWKHWEFLMPA